MDLFDSHYYKLNRVLLSIVGLWPYQTSWARRAHIAMFTLVISSSVFVQVASFFTNDIDVDYLSDTVPILLIVFGGQYQIVNRLLYLDKMKWMLDEIKREWAVQKTEAEAKILEDHAEISRSFTLGLTVYVACAVVGFTMWTLHPELLDILLPLNESRPREQPFAGEFFIDAEKYFYVIRLHMYTTLFLVPIVTISLGTIFVAYVQHACGLFTLLGYRLERIFDNEKALHMMKSNVSATKMKNWIRDNITFCVHCHRSAMEFICTLESCYTLSFLLEMGTNLVMFSITMAQIMAFTSVSERMIRSVLFGCAQVLYFFMCNYIGQSLIDTTSVLCEKVYNGQWYKVAAEDQKLILPIMVKCYKPSVITTCKLYVLSLESFATGMQTAVSFCMVLSQL